MVDKMDIFMDNPSFDLQSVHVSFEERRWLSKQVQKSNNTIQLIIDLHKTIRGCEQFSIIPSKLSTSSLISEVLLENEHPLYYPSVVNGCTDNKIDQFRLYHQQVFQLIFDDLCLDFNYRIFIIIMEGFIFYSSQTAKEYKSLFEHEIRKLLSSFDTYIQSRSSKINDLLKLLQKTSIPSYTIVHTDYENNVGILCQLLPKIQYIINPKTEYNSIVTVDEYAKHTISPEELRHIDYSMNMKNKRHAGLISQTPYNVRSASSFNFFGVPSQINGSGTFSSSLPFQILHSLPIIYPYDNNTVYSQKYPLFWTGNNHTNENSEALFQNITIEKDTPEFLFVQRSFYKTVSQEDINIAFIERIQNSHLWEKFSSHRSYMRRKNGIENLKENWLFHGTNSDNHHRIMSHGFNRSYCRDYVYYGRGVYFSRYACYSCRYSDRRDLSFLFLCRVLVGHHTNGANDIRVPPTITLSDGRKIQADSTTDHIEPYSIVCTFHDDQNYPEYIITYMNKSSER